jgi:hypothetical protein
MAIITPARAISKHGKLSWFYETTFGAGATVPTDYQYLETEGPVVWSGVGKKYEPDGSIRPGHFQGPGKVSLESESVLKFSCLLTGFKLAADMIAQINPATDLQPIHMMLASAIGGGIEMGGYGTAEAACSTTVVKVHAGEGLTFQVGSGLLVTTSTDKEVAVIKTISTDDLTIRHKFLGTPTETSKITGGIVTWQRNDGANTLYSDTFIFQASGSDTCLQFKGCRPKSCKISAAYGEYIKADFEYHVSEAIDCAGQGNPTSGTWEYSAGKRWPQHVAKYMYLDLYDGSTTVRLPIHSFNVDYGLTTQRIPDPTTSLSSGGHDFRVVDRQPVIEVEIDQDVTAGPNAQTYANALYRLQSSRQIYLAVITDFGEAHLWTMPTARIKGPEPRPEDANGMLAVKLQFVADEYLSDTGTGAETVPGDKTFAYCAF